MAEFVRCLALLFAMFLLTASANLAQAATHAWPGHIEAARADWNSTAPPRDGWVEATLPDDWSRRWPRFDGVVWYRLTWNEAAPATSTSLFVDYLNMAGVIQLNGSEIARDASLIEPLSRMWNRPRYFLLSPPLLRAGENVLLLRVSGLAAYEPGLGRVRVGEPATMRALFEHEHTVRLYWQIGANAAIATLGLFFVALWLIRRREVAYGWYSAQNFAWLVVAWNQITTSTWPFASTDAFEAVNTAAFLTFSACYTMFVLRFCGRRWPRREAALWIAVAAGVLWLFFAPPAMIGMVRALLTVLNTLYLFVPNGMLLYFALRNARLDQRVLSLVGFVNLLAGAHDTLVFTGVFNSNIYYASHSALISAVGVALVLAWNFARSLRRIEGFNVELQSNVAEARAELATTLSRQHELELVHARLGERVNLAHDLHDGLGGMLIGTINELEQAPENVPSSAMLTAFKELRDDLRLIIDTATAQRYGELSLAQLLAPLRHRMTRLFDVHGIDCAWRVAGVEDVYLTSTQSLDLLRILQEALANVLKHSGATYVQVELVREDGVLRMEVTDNGVGIPPGAQSDGLGTGMRSMKARAQRLGGTLTIGSEPGSTVMRLRYPHQRSASQTMRDA